MRNNYWGIKQTKELRNLSKTISCAVRTKNTTWTVNEWKHFDILCTRKHNFLCCNLCFKVRCAVFVLFSWKYQASIHLNPKHGTKSKDYTFFSNIGILILKGINNMAFVFFKCQQLTTKWEVVRLLERLCESSHAGVTSVKSQQTLLTEWQGKAMIGLGSDKHILLGLWLFSDSTWAVDVVFLCWLSS